MKLCGALLLTALGAAPAAAAADAPALRELRLPGAAAYDPARVLGLLRLRLGEPLRFPPEHLAEVLARRYHDDGYPGARVGGAFDEATGVLSLTVDEGRLDSVALPGLGPAAERRALAALRLETGRVLREDDVNEAYGRLRRESQEALGSGDYKVVPEGGGLRLELQPEVRRVELAARLAGPHTSGYYNRVDGFNLGAGLDLRLADLRRYEHTWLSASASYATASQKLRYALGASRPVLGRLSLGYEYHDLTDRDDAYRLSGLDEAGGTSLLEKSLSDFYRRRGHEAYAFLRLSRAAQLGLSFRADRYESLPLLTDGNPFGGGEPRDNPPVDEGAQHSLLVTLRVTNGRSLYAEDADERRSFLLRSLWGSLQEPPAGLRLEASLERASAGGLGGDFTFTRLTASLRGRHELLPRLRLDTRALAGLADDGTPRQRRLTLGGQGSLRGYAQDAFLGERLLALTLEPSFAPGHGLPRLVGFYDGGATWRGAGGDSGWKSALGGALRWPAEGALFLRVDLARPVGTDAPEGWQAYWRVQVPF